MKTLFLAWQDHDSRSWYPIGRLAVDGEHYEFRYLHGVLDAAEMGFRPLESFPSFGDVYESDRLFPLFDNRVLSPSRPDYASFVEYLNLPATEHDPIALLARSGGRRATDTLEVFPYPDRTDWGGYHIHFFVHGIRHLPESSIRRIEQLQPQEQLRVAWDFENIHDPQALMLRTDDKYPGDRHIVGYCPRYLSMDALAVGFQCKGISAHVERVNPPPAPLQFRLLCSFTSCWPERFEPFSAPAYQSLVADPSATIPGS